MWFSLISDGQYLRLGTNMLAGAENHAFFVQTMVRNKKRKKGVFIMKRFIVDCDWVVKV